MNGDSGIIRRLLINYFYCQVRKCHFEICRSPLVSTCWIALLLLVGDQFDLQTVVQVRTKDGVRPVAGSIRWHLPKYDHLLHTEPVFLILFFVIERSQNLYYFQICCYVHILILSICHLFEFQTNVFKDFCYFSKIG